MQLSFTGRTYLVTGGGSGIGKGVAAGLALSGADVMIVGRDAGRLSVAAEDIAAQAFVEMLERFAAVEDRLWQLEL